MVVWLEALESEIVGAERFVASSFGGNDRSVANEGVVDSWVGDEVGLKFGEINVEGAVEA